MEILTKTIAALAIFFFLFPIAVSLLGAFLSMHINEAKLIDYPIVLGHWCAWLFFLCTAIVLVTVLCEPQIKL